MFSSQRGPVLWVSQRPRACHLGGRADPIGAQPKSLATSLGMSQNGWFHIDALPLNICKQFVFQTYWWTFTVGRKMPFAERKPVLLCGVQRLPCCLQAGNAWLTFQTKFPSTYLKALWSLLIPVTPWSGYFLGPLHGRFPKVAEEGLEGLVMPKGLFLSEEHKQKRTSSTAPNAKTCRNATWRLPEVLGDSHINWRFRIFARTVDSKLGLVPFWFWCWASTVAKSR